MSYKVKDLVKLYPHWIIRKNGRTVLTDMNISLTDKKEVDAIMKAEPITELERSVDCIEIIIGDRHEKD